MTTAAPEMTAADTVKDIHVDVMRCAECGARFGVDAAFCPFDGVPLVAATWDKALDPLAGLVIDDRYEVLEPLGEGGMGTVYRARHVTLDRHFALKVLRRDLAADTELAARFVREAKATAAVRHPSVVAITDFGELGDGIPYFVMELLLGETLAARIRGRGLMAPRSATKVARLVAEALEASHAANVIHRDLKPENVFLVGAAAGHAPEDEIRLVDFGAAKIVGASKLTRPGVVFGTPYYMSPEQANGQQVDVRADVYSLGVLLYEMVTGTVPFEADTYMGVLTKHLFEIPERPSGRVPAGVVLGDLDQVIMTALAKDPSARFATMGAFARALAELERKVPEPPSSSEHLPRRTVPLVGMTSMSTADRIELAVGRRVDEQVRGRRKRLALLAGLAACAAVGAGVSLVVALDRGSKVSEEGSVANAAVEPTAPPPSIAAPAPTNATVTAAAAASSSTAAAAAQASGRAEPKVRPRADASRAGAPPASAAHPAKRPPDPEDFKDPWGR